MAERNLDTRPKPQQTPSLSQAEAQGVAPEDAKPLLPAGLTVEIRGYFDPQAGEDRPGATLAFRPRDRDVFAKRDRTLAGLLQGVPIQVLPEGFQQRYIAAATVWAALDTAQAPPEWLEDALLVDQQLAVLLCAEVEAHWAGRFPRVARTSAAGPGRSVLEFHRGVPAPDAGEQGGAGDAAPPRT